MKNVVSDICAMGIQTEGSSNTHCIIMPNVLAVLHGCVLAGSGPVLFV